MVVLTANDGFQSLVVNNGTITAIGMIEMPIFSMNNVLTIQKSCLNIGSIQLLGYRILTHIIGVS